MVISQAYQIDGVAVGSLLGPSLTEIFMNALADGDNHFNVSGDFS